MTVDPRVGFWLSIFLAIVGVLAGGATQLTTLFGEHMSNMVLAGSVLTLAAGNAVNAVLHAIPASTNLSPAEEKKFPLGPKP